MCGEGMHASTDTGALEATYRPPHEGWTLGPGLHRVIAWERGLLFALAAVISGQWAPSLSVR